MDAAAARSILLAQHDRIHGDLNRCGSLARGLCNGEPLSPQLGIAIAQLRADLTQHLASEAELTGPLLDELTDRNRLRVTRMLEDHLAEHNLFLELLSGAAHTVAMRLAELTHTLEAHMAAEERTLLCPVMRWLAVDTAAA